MKATELCTLFGLLLVASSSAQRCPPAIQIDKTPQVFIMSDISNEPDDTMSFIRLLLHSDQYNITGLVATSSTWLNNSVVPREILNTTHAFGLVQDNLNVHTSGRFLTSDYLSSIVKEGQPVYGTRAIGMSPLSSGAELLITVVDGMPDREPLFTQAWGGTNVLAEALAHVKATRAALDLERFVKKLRVYSISDQDDAGPWIRQNFPQIPYIVSLHGFNAYGLATWSGISGERYYYFDGGGPDTSLVTEEYVKQNFQIGPLGSHYPDIAYIMEGDSPALMHTMVNGLNGGPSDQPSWGGWGGRYILLDRSRQSNVYSDTYDQVVGKDNKTYTSNHATIWRWRQAYQDEMSARVQWSVLSDYASGSHPPVVQVNGSCGSEPLIYTLPAEATISLDASGTWDPDANLTGKNPLEYHWFQYREITDVYTNTVDSLPRLNLTLSDDGKVAETKLPTREEACKRPTGLQATFGVEEVCQQYHVILEVTGSGTPPIRRYKRVILKVEQEEGTAGSSSRNRDEL